MNQAPQTTNIFLSGVGGQGVVLASQVLVKLAFGKGLDAKQSEVHGLSQRGGSVTGHVRWAAPGAKVFSPVIMEGDAHFLFGMEPLEALRSAHYIRPDGVIVMDEHPILPASVMANESNYPENVQEQLAQYATVYALTAHAIATELGQPRAANIVLLGALSMHIQGFTAGEWKDAIAACVPAKHKELNIKAFEKGARAMEALMGP